VKNRFYVEVNTAEEILSNPPPRYRHVNLIFTPFAIRLGTADHPCPGWTDFAGLRLFRWCIAVWNLTRGDGADGPVVQNGGRVCLI
jgi:hypothetical protein